MRQRLFILPLVFLFILIFILGLRYGQSIEKNNKVVDYLLSITPSPSLFPTPSVTYQEYKSKKYGIKFTFPANLEIKENATIPAVLFRIKN